jgi:hypothetical protein
MFDAAKEDGLKLTSTHKIGSLCDLWFRNQQGLKSQAAAF